MAYPASSVITAYLALSVLSILLLYGIAVGMGHVSPFVPHVAYLGDQPFESTIFTQLMVIVAALFGAIVQIQYVRVSVYLHKKKEKREKVRANIFCVCVGYASAMGLFVLACFQEMNAYYIHHLGQLVYLLGSVLYFSLHTFILTEQNKSKKVVRLALTVLMISFFVLFLTGYIAAVIKFQKPWEERYYWGRDDGGWIFHIASATSEWALTCLFYCYLLTFYFDFQQDKPNVGYCPGRALLRRRHIKTPFFQAQDKFPFLRFLWDAIRLRKPPSPRAPRGNTGWMKAVKGGRGCNRRMG